MKIDLHIHAAQAFHNDASRVQVQPYTADNTSCHSTAASHKCQNGSGKTSLSDEEFKARLIKHLSDEIRTPTSPEKLRELKRQVQSGTYAVDLDKLINKMTNL